MIGEYKSVLFKQCSRLASMPRCEIRNFNMDYFSALFYSVWGTGSQVVVLVVHTRIVNVIGRSTCNGECDWLVGPQVYLKL